LENATAKSVAMPLTEGHGVFSDVDSVARGLGLLDPLR
jgi:hypothetical protein